MILAALLLVVFAAPSGPGEGLVQESAVLEQQVLDLFSGLPLPFAIEGTEIGPEGHVFRLRSTEPVSRTGSGALFLRAKVTIAQPGPEAAEGELTQLLKSSDPDLGLSYAWDYVASHAGSMVHFHAECTFSEENFRKVALEVARHLAGPPARPLASFWCRCGGGCRSGAPFLTPGEESRRLPPVRREVPDEEGDYDNRLDPSGVWTSSIGELTVVHRDHRLAFTYMAVFGDTAHICEAAGVAGLVGTDRYEYVDEQGTVAFIITETALRMELVDGIASFCGAGWSGDRFTTEEFAPPARCTVTADRSPVHVVEYPDPEPSISGVVKGDKVEAVPARLDAGEKWFLVRTTSPMSRTLGLLKGDQLECKTEP